MFTSCFLQKIRIENRKETKGKKTYHFYHHSLGYYLKQASVPLVSAIICRPESQCVHLRTFIVLHGYFCLSKTSGPTAKAAGSEFLLQVILCKVRSWCISQENLVGHKQILYQADQNSQTKNLSYFIFSKSSDETFCFSKDKFIRHLIYGGG